MPRHTGRRLSGRARKRAWAIHAVNIYNAVLRNEVQALKEENNRLKLRIFEQDRQGFTGGKEGALVLRKHYERHRPGRLMVLSVVLDVERLKHDLYMNSPRFTDGYHIARTLSREIEAGVIKLIEEEVLHLRDNPNGN